MTPRHDFPQEKSQQLLSPSGAEDLPVTERVPIAIYFTSGKASFCGYKSGTHRDRLGNALKNNLTAPTLLNLAALGRLATFLPVWTVSAWLRAAPTQTWPALGPGLETLP